MNAGFFFTKPSTLMRHLIDALHLIVADPTSKGDQLTEKAQLCGADVKQANKKRERGRERTMEKGSLIWIGIGALALLVLLTSPCDARSELPRSGSFLSFSFLDASVFWESMLRHARHTRSREARHHLNRTSPGTSLQTSFLGLVLLLMMRAVVC